MRRFLALALIALLPGCDPRKSPNDYMDDLRNTGSKLKGCQSKTLLDQEIVVSAHSWQAMGFAIKDESCSVSVRVSGVRDTGKGFKVQVIEGGEVENLKNDLQYKYLPSLSGLDVGSFSKSDDLPRGGYSIVVHNSNNIMNSMAVHVVVAVSPR